MKNLIWNLKNASKCAPMLLLSLSSFALAEPGCYEADKLFDDSGRTFSCQSETLGEVCIKTGYHDSKHLDGMRIFDLHQDTEERLDYVFFHDPLLLGCFPTLGLIACANERVIVKEDRIKAYSRHRADATS